MNSSAVSLLATIVAASLLWCTVEGQQPQSVLQTVVVDAARNVSLFDVYESMTVDVDPSDYTIHDPSRIITVGNKQMIAVTGKAQEDGYDCGIETWWRNTGDKGEWQPGQCLFRTIPGWVAVQAPLNDGAFWAPELDLKKSSSTGTTTLTLLYSVSEQDARPGGPNTCVGVAVSTTGLEGFPDNLAWEDSGDALTCIIGSDYEEEERSAIDPSVFWGIGDDDGKLFLVTGGGRIIGTELNTTTYYPLSEQWFGTERPEWSELAKGPQGVDDDSWLEAPYIHANSKNGYYYLFVNWGACCSGVDSTYEIRVGRSLNPMGPYVDKDGTDMMEGGGTRFIKSKKRIIGPGHLGIWKKGRRKKKSYISFHYYDKRRDGNSWIAEKELKWKSGWPKTKKKVVSDFPKSRLVDSDSDIDSYE